MTTTKHISVLLQEAIESLNIQPGGVYIDATLGGGGHSREILKLMKFQGTLVVFDQDPNPIKAFAEGLASRGLLSDTSSAIARFYSTELNIFLVPRNFAELQQVLKEIGVIQVAGVLADLGLSTDQLLDQERGFSYLTQGKLDMRMNPGLRITAADLLNGLYQKELSELFLKLGNIDFSGKLAKAIVRYRQTKAITKASELRHIVQKIVPSGSRLGANRHPEAKVFQALRIAVNDELNSLKQFLPQAFETLALGGRLSLITFHSGEDRIVKNYFRDQVIASKAQFIHKLLKPTEAELSKNQRSHSAKLRSIEKLKN